MKKIQDQILDFLKTKEASGSDIANKLKINRLTITKYLNVLYARDEVNFKSVGRAKIWHLKKDDVVVRKSEKKDVVDEYKESLDHQKKILDYLRNNPYGVAWDLLVKDLNLDKEQVFSCLKVLKNADLITYRDKGKRLWFINLFPTAKTLSDIDVEGIKKSIFHALQNRPLSLPALSEELKLDMQICGNVLGTLKDQNLISYYNRGDTKFWYVHKLILADDSPIVSDTNLLLQDNKRVLAIDRTFILGLYQTFNKELLRKVGYFQGLYSARLRKYSGNESLEEVFIKQVDTFFSAGLGRVNKLTAQPLKLEVESSFIAETVKEILPQFCGEPVCTLICGYLEGVYEAVFDEKIRVVETECLASNNSVCVFGRDSND